MRMRTVIQAVIIMMQWLWRLPSGSAGAIFCNGQVFLLDRGWNGLDGSRQHRDGVRAGRGELGSGDGRGDHGPASVGVRNAPRAGQES